jgi:polysaccharide export outer membrane protein
LEFLLSADLKRRQVEVFVMRAKSVWTATILAATLSSIVLAQQPQSSPVALSPPPSLDNQGIKNYLLGPGDVLDVRVFGQPDLSSINQVDGDGNISSLPFIDTPIPAKCRNEREVQKDIAAAYGKFINNPQVSVRITERNSRQPATVFGAVRQPTKVDMRRKVRLNEVVAASGGFTERASGTIQILHTEPVMCPEPGEEADAQPIDATRIPLQIVKIAELRAGRPQANPPIRPGDYVLVTEADPVYITGSVVSPTGIFLTEELKLSRALAMVGGVRPEAKTSDVKIYRTLPGSSEQQVIHVDLGAIKKSQIPDVPLQAYDVIEVPEASAFSSKRLSTTILGALTGGMMSAVSTSGAILPSRVLY